MLSAIAINGLALHDTATREVVSVGGLIGVSPVRRSVRVRPTAHGSIDESRYLDESLITIVGDVFGTQEECFAELRTLSQAFMATLESPGILSWTEGATGLSLQRTVKLASGVEPELSEGSGILRYQVIFAASDPVSYSQALTTAVGNPLSAVSGGKTYPLTYSYVYALSAGGSATFLNAGIRPTAPLLRVFGTVVNPQIVLGDKRIVLNGSVTAPDYLEIDLHERTIFLVQAGLRISRLGMLDPSTRWFSLPAGESTLTLLGSEFDGNAKLTILGRSAY